MMSEVDFTVVIPCYNEEDAIETTVKSIRKVLVDAGPYEMIIVNDGSTDRSSQILDQLKKDDPALKIINIEKNSGYGSALKKGMRRASGKLIVITDADGTYPNERLPELIKLANCTDADMVVGARTSDDAVYPFIRRIPKVLLRAYTSWLAGQNITDINSGMRVFRHSTAKRFFNILPDSFSFTTTITLAMLTNSYDVHYVPIEYRERMGKSKIRPIRDTLNFFQLILRTGTYFAPLKVFLPIAGILGMGFLLSLCYDLFVLRNLTDKTIMLLLFSISMTMFSLLADMIDKRMQK